MIFSKSILGATGRPTVNTNTVANFTTLNGASYMNDGQAAFVSTSTASSDVYIGGFRYSATGALRVYDASAADPSPLLINQGIVMTSTGQVAISNAASVTPQNLNGVALSATGVVFVNTLAFQLQFADLGAGVVSTVEAIGNATPTFTRATTAWTKLSTGLWGSVASGSPRSFYGGFDTTVGAYLGYLAEGSRQNLCLQARDLSTTWTPVNTTPLKDQVGIDGVTNSASSLLATGNGGTCLQTITEAATTSALSMFIKRLVGTGTITIQQGLTTLDVTASVNSVTYTRVELDASVLNPAIGIVLGTSGDKIAVDMVQFENGAFASTPIPTTTVAVTRNADVLTYPTSPWLNASAGTVLFSTNAPWQGTVPVAISDGTFNEIIYFQLTGSNIQNVVIDGGVVQAQMTLISNPSSGNFSFAGAYSANDFAAVATTGIIKTDASGTLPTVTTLSVGNAIGQSTFVPIRRLTYYGSRLPNAQLQALTSG